MTGAYCGSVAEYAPVSRSCESVQRRRTAEGMGLPGWPKRVLCRNSHGFSLATVPMYSVGLAGGAGDLDGDGAGELLVSRRPSESSGGDAWLLTGPFAGTMATATAIAELDFPVYPPRAIGSVVAGDLDGDGLGDLAASTWDTTYLLFGGPGL